MSENIAYFHVAHLETGIDWEGESKISVSRDGQDLDVKELTRRWVALDVPAGHGFAQFVSEGFQVMKRILIGVHDLRYSQDGGETWPVSNSTASLDVITGLYIEPDSEAAREAQEDSCWENDPFVHGPVILERLNFVHPVFDENDSTVEVLFSEKPILKQYPTPHALIEALHASIDDFEKTLGLESYTLPGLT